MDYDFIEIGTSDFDTLTQKASDDVVGLAIEPLAHYLKQLPSPSKVRKLCAAVSPNNVCGSSNVYWLSEHVIREKGLPDWLRGCNSLGKPHPRHIDFGVVPLLQVVSIPVLPISFIWVMHLVDEVQFLKLDTEGGDADILMHLYAYLELNRLKWPKKIAFEGNELVSPAKIKHVTQLYGQKGYTSLLNGNDVTMALK